MLTVSFHIIIEIAGFLRLFIPVGCMIVLRMRVIEQPLRLSVNGGLDLIGIDFIYNYLACLCTVQVCWEWNSLWSHW